MYTYILMMTDSTMNRANELHAYVNFQANIVKVQSLVLNYNRTESDSIE